MAGGKTVATLKSELPAASHVGRVPAGSALSSDHAIAVLAALAQPSRLEIFRLLLKSEPDGLAAGAIAEMLEAPHNSISTHLAILVRAGLLRSARNGRTIIYRADIEGMRALIGFLVNDCCDSHPELCSLAAVAGDGGCGGTATKTMKGKGK
jgi:ArsR family transcriptional regulator